ncbi:MAG: hypothetical protein LUD77_00155 [Clostridiales bacterium]|nr:hypothetical protein [Clostridiales bacterium]
MDSLLNRDINGLAEKDTASPIEIKKLTVKNLIDTLNEAEVDFLDVTLRQLKKLRKSEYDY